MGAINCGWRASRGGVACEPHKGGLVVAREADEGVSLAELWRGVLFLGDTLPPKACTPQSFVAQLFAYMPILVECGNRMGSVLFLAPLPTLDLTQKENPFLPFFKPFDLLCLCIPP